MYFIQFLLFQEHETIVQSYKELLQGIELINIFIDLMLSKVTQKEIILPEVIRRKHLYVVGTESIAVRVILNNRS